MSFGFAVGDFLQVGALAWTLYRDCYKVAEAAPQEFQLLVTEIQTMSTSLMLLQEEVKDPDSSLCQSGEGRVELVNNMVRGIYETLLALEKYATKYDISGPKNGGSRLQIRQRVRNFKWSVHRKSIEESRSRLHQQNGLLTLVLTSAGNSSLQRIQESTSTLETDVQVIRDYISNQHGGKDLMAPSLSMVDDETLRSSISAILLKNAEVVQPWTTIGVTQWIDTGRWWLQGCELELYALKEGDEVSTTTYASLLKASWILVDIIACHPQVTFISGKTRAEITALCVGIKNDFKRIEEIQVKLPKLTDIQGHDLQIWENQVAAPTIRRHHDPLSDEQDTSNLWAVDGEEIAFFVQRAACKIRTRSSAIICDILFLLKRDGKRARLVANAQVQIEAIDIHFNSRVRVERSAESLLVNDCEIFLKKPRDLELLDSLIDAANFYFLERKQVNNSLDAFRAYLFIFTIKNSQAVLVAPVIPDQLQPYNKDEASDAARIISTASSIKQQAIAGIDVNQRLLLGANGSRNEVGLLSWAIQIGHEDLTRLLLEEDAQYTKDPWHDFNPLMIAARCNHEAVAKLLVDRASAKGSLSQDLKAHDRLGWGAIHYAASHGDEKVARLYLRAGADINDRGWNNMTPLHCSAMHDLGATAQMLFDKGAKRNERTKSSMTPLMIACQNKSEAVIEICLAEDVDILAEDNTTSNALHHALEMGVHWTKDQPVSKPTFNNLFDRYWQKKGIPKRNWPGASCDTVTFEMNSDWAMLMLDSPHATIRYHEGIPANVIDCHQRAFKVVRPANVKQQFFVFAFNFQVTHRHEELAFATEHGTLGTRGSRGRVTIVIEGGGTFTTQPTGSPRNFRKHPNVKAASHED